MLNRRGDSGRPCSIPDLRGKTLPFLPLSMILDLDIGLSYIGFNMKYVPSISPLLRNFIIRGNQHGWQKCNYSIHTIDSINSCKPSKFINLIISINSILSILFLFKTFAYMFHISNDQRLKQNH